MQLSSDLLRTQRQIQPFSEAFVCPISDLLSVTNDSIAYAVDKGSQTFGADCLANQSYEEPPD